MKKRTVQTAFIVLTAAVIVGVGSFFLIRLVSSEPPEAVVAEEKPEVESPVLMEEEADPAPSPEEDGTTTVEADVESTDDEADSASPPPVSEENLELADGLSEAPDPPGPVPVEPEPEPAPAAPPTPEPSPRPAPTESVFSPPFLSLSSPKPDEFYHDSLRVEGRVANSDGDLSSWDQVKSVSWRFSGTSQTGQVNPTGRGNFTFLVPTTNLKGSQLLILTAEGLNGLTREISISLKEDLRPAVISLEYPVSGDVFGDRIEIRGRLSHPSGSLSRLESLKWFIPGGDPAADVAFEESGAFSFAFYPTGTSDTLTLQLSARTTRGAAADLSVTLADDGKGPNLTLTTGGEIPYLPGSPVEINGRVDYPRNIPRDKVFNSLTYRIFGTSREGNIPVDEDGRFSLTLGEELSGGEQVLELTALNNRGNPTSRTVVLRPRREEPVATAVTASGAAPAVPAPVFSLPPEDSVIYASRLELKGKVTGASDGGAVEWVIAGTDRSGRQNLSADGSFTVSAATDGLQGSQLLQLKASGPGGTGTASFLVRDDGTGPFLRIDSPEEGSVYRSLVEVTGKIADSTDAPNSTREVQDLRWEVPGTSVAGRAELDRNGDFNFSFSTMGLSETLVVKIIARDKNLRITEKNLTLINDGVGPYLEITSPGPGSFYAAAPLQVVGVLGNRPDARESVAEVKSLSYRLSGSDQEERTVFFQEDGSFFFSVDMRKIKGPQILELNAESYTGNRTGLTLQLQDGTVPPEIRFTSPEPESLYGVGFWLTGRVVDPYLTNLGFGGIAEAVCRVTPLKFVAGEDTSIEQPLTLNADGTFRLGISTVKMRGPQKVEVEVEARNGNRINQTFTIHQGENAVPTLIVESRDRAALLDWDDMPGVLRYDLIYTADGTVPSSENGRRLSGVEPPVSVSGLTNGRIHSFLIRAETAVGPGESGIIRTVPLSRDSFGLTARGEFGQIQLGWRNFSGLEGYRILRAREDEAVYTDISGVVRGQSYIDTRVEYGRRYLYRVVPAGFEHIQGTAVAAESLSAPSVRVAEAHLVGGFTPVRVDVLGGYAYTAAGPEGFKVVDIGDPNNMQVVGELTGIPSGQVRIRGDYAYLTDAEGGLQVVSILDPNNPILLGSRPTAAGLDIIPYENSLFMADGEQGLKVFDVSQARRPVRKASLDGSASYSLSLEGTRLYSSAGEGGLQIYDISLPDQPALVGSYLNGPVYLNAVREDLGFVAGNTGWLEILDLKNAERPTMISRIPLKDPRQLTALGDYLFVAAGGEGLKIYDITNPATPFLFDEAEGTEVTGLDVKENRVYLADRNGLRVIETYLKGESFVVAQGAPDSRPFNISLDENRAYLSSSQRGVTVMDISRPANLEASAFLGRAETIDAVLSVVWEDFLLVADGSGGMGVYGTTPVSPDQEEEPRLPFLARAELPSGAPPAISVAVAGGWAYFVSKDQGIYPVDLSPLKSGNDKVDLFPGSLVPLSGARDIVSYDGVLWVADRREGLVGLSRENPSLPVEEARIRHPGARKVAVGEDNIFLIDPQGLHIYNRKNLTKSGQYLTRFAENITVQGPYVYLSEGYRGLVVLDVSSPARPVKVSSCSTVYALGAAVRGNFAFLVDAESLKTVQIFIPEWLTR